MPVRGPSPLHLHVLHLREQSLCHIDFQITEVFVIFEHLSTLDILDFRFTETFGMHNFHVLLWREDMVHHFASIEDLHSHGFVLVLDDINLHWMNGEDVVKVHISVKLGETSVVESIDRDPGLTDASLTDKAMRAGLIQWLQTGLLSWRRFIR